MGLLLALPLLLLELLLQQLVLKPLSAECFGVSHDFAVVEGFGFQRGIAVECRPRHKRAAVPTSVRSIRLQNALASANIRSIRAQCASASRNI